ncbi:MAG TPA: hypothetical protein VLE27_07280, partial [Thermoanaerobaculia bacterium]|nr:hypothetical protein [Thermoanaerobaculia bacterium]
DEDAVRLLGGLDTALFHRLLEAVLAGDSQGVSAAVGRIEEEGWDPRHVYGQFLAFCRDALHLAMGGSPEAVDLPGEEAHSLAALAKGSGYENMLRVMNQLLASEQIVRRSETGALAVEIAWLRAAELPKLIRVEEILAGGTVGATIGGTMGRSEAAPAPRPAPAAARPAPAAAPRPAAAPAPVPPPRPQPVAETQPAPARPMAAVQAPPVSRDPVRAFLDEVSKRSSRLAGSLDSAERIHFEDGRLTIVAPAGDSWLRSRLQGEANRQVLEESLAAVWGAGTGWRLVEGASAPKAAAAETPAAEPEVENPAIQTVLEIFGGRVEAVEEHGSYTED